MVYPGQFAQHVGKVGAVEVLGIDLGMAIRVFVVYRLEAEAVDALHELLNAVGGSHECECAR